MTVLIVSEPGQDGVFRFVEALVRFLVSRSVRVHLAYSHWRSCERLAALVGFVRQNGGVTLNLTTANQPAWSDLPALGKLRRLVRATRPDLIHSHSSKAGVLARALAALGVRIPQVYQPHAYAGMKPQAGSARLIYDGIESLMGRTGMTINVSSDEHDYALQRLHVPDRRTVCIPNGVDSADFSAVSAAEKNALRRQLGLPAGVRILGTLGRASAQKDPLTLYRAFAEALAREPDLVLCHVGHGELDGELDGFIVEHGLEGRIIRLPYLSTPVDFYRAIDGFILTSTYEGLSLAILEAMACDLPLVLSDAPGNREFMSLPLSHLWTAPVGDVPAFAQAIAQWADGVSAGTVPSNHRALVLKRFDSRLSFMRIQSLYHHLVAAHRATAARPPLAPTSSSWRPHQGPA